MLDIVRQENRIMEEAVRRQANGTMNQQRYYQIAGRVNRVTQNYLRNIRNTRSYKKATSLDNGAVGGTPEMRKYSRRTYMGMAKGW